jgi:hypothetical protein
MNNGILIATQSGEVSLNVDQRTLEMCLKTKSNFTHTVYSNICNGEKYVIETGSFDWFVFGVVMVFVVLFALFLIKVLFDL